MNYGENGSAWDRMSMASKLLVVILMTVYFMGGLIAGMVGLMRAGRGADLPLPKPRPKHVIEECMGPGVTPAMAQVLADDKACPSGKRWKNHQ